jgi:tripartite ATP-independent transporter DctP family solute receptor
VAARAQKGKMLVKAADVHPLDHPTVEAIVRMGKKLETATSGRINSQMFPEMHLGSERETIEKARAGALQLCRASLATLGAIVDELNVLALPYLFRDEAHMRKVIDGAIGRELLDRITGTPSRLIGLGWMDAGTRHIYARKPIGTPADLKGQKIRTTDGPIVADTIQAMGGTAVPLAVDETPAALRTGAVDGGESNPPTLLAERHFESAKVYSLTGHLTIPEVFVFSRHEWEKLAKDDQALIVKLSREAQLEQRKLWDTMVAGSVEKLKAGGVQFVKVEKKAFHDATRAVREKHGAKWPELIKRIEQTR